MIRGAPIEAADGSGPAVPTPAAAVRHGLPVILREGFLPLAAFFVGWKVSGVGLGVAASACVSAAIYLHERRAGRDGLLVRIALASVAVEATVGLVSRSTTAYLGTGVLENALWAVAFLGSAVIRRPLAGVFACAMYPFPAGSRHTREFTHVFGVVSVVWGLYLLARSALQVAILLHGTVGGFVIVAFVTGKPIMLGLFAWSTWYPARVLPDDAAAPEAPGADPVEPPAGDQRSRGRWLAP